MINTRKTKSTFNGSGHHFHGHDMDDLIIRTMTTHLNHPAPDACLGTETHLFNVLLTAKSCTYKLDMSKELWLNIGRWSRLIKEYIRKDDLEEFIQLSKVIYTREARMGATTEMKFIAPERADKKHRWGGCLMGVVFRGEYDNYPTITLYSRTTYLGYMGLLDAAIIHLIATMISDGHPEKISFRWYITSMQLHSFKSLPYMFTNTGWWESMNNWEQNRGFISTLPPTWRECMRWYCRLMDAFRKEGIKMMDTEKYGPYKRVKRRWLEHTDNIPGSCTASLPVSRLTFEKAQ